MSINKNIRSIGLMAGILFSMLIFISCGGEGVSEQTHDHGKDAKEDEHHDAHSDPTIATLTEEQIKAVGIELGSIEEKQLTAALKANGTLKVPNQNKASINSVYSGVVKSLLVQPGYTVKKGQVVASISNPDFIEAQSQYLNVVSEIGLADIELKRQKELNAGNAGALKNLQSAETKLRTLHTAKSALMQRIQLMGVNPSTLANGKLSSVIFLKSPISGVVSTVSVQIGSFVDASTTVAEVVDNSQLHLDLFVYEKDLSKLKDGQLIHFTLTNNPGKEYDAQIFSLGSSFEGESKAVSVHAKVMGDKTGLIDGMNITAAISLNKAVLPAVPSEAIVNLGGQDYIFVLKEDRPGAVLKDSLDNAAGTNHQIQKGVRSFARIPVAKGTTDIGFTEITLLQEIPKDAAIVVKGAFFILAKMTNKGEHEH